ncbi:MAG: NAD(P)-binding domain-containing protein, partial [Actinomycetota bacterium]
MSSGDSGSTALQVCLFGLGEAGSLLATDLVRAGASVSAYDPAEVATPAGVTRRPHPALALRPLDRSVDLVLAATGGDESRLALLQAIDAIDAGTLYADVASAAPGVKLDLADQAIRRDVEFVDVALLGMVPGNGLATPALAAGPGADRLADMVNPLGAKMEPITGPPGAATAKKLLRSVMMKGMASVLVEA